jgi:hypothetical protein
VALPCIYVLHSDLVQLLYFSSLYLKSLSYGDFNQFKNPVFILV